MMVDTENRLLAYGGCKNELEIVLLLPNCNSSRYKRFWSGQKVLPFLIEWVKSAPGHEEIMLNAGVRITRLLHATLALVLK